MTTPDMSEYQAACTDVLPNSGPLWKNGLAAGTATSATSVCVCVITGSGQREGFSLTRGKHLFLRSRESVFATCEGMSVHVHTTILLKWKQWLVCPRLHSVNADWNVREGLAPVMRKDNELCVSVSHGTLSDLSVVPGCDRVVSPSNWVHTCHCLYSSITILHAATI